MKLHENQLNLIRHLIRFNLMAYEDCLEMLDTDGCKDQTALSYAFNTAINEVFKSSIKSWKRIVHEYVLDNLDQLFHIHKHLQRIYVHELVHLDQLLHIHIYLQHIHVDVVLYLYLGFAVIHMK